MSGQAATSSILLATNASANTNYLYASNFNFNLPSNTNAINGIQVTVKRTDRYATDGLGDTADTVDNGIFLLNASGNIVGTNHADYVDEWNSLTTISYGSSTDNWGAGLSYTDINSPNFGAAISANLFMGLYTSAGRPRTLNMYAWVYSVTITVWYTTGSVTTYDSGSVSVTVNGTVTQPVQYSNGSTGVSIAGQLASEISAFGFVTASNNGTNVITITSTSNGSGTNYPLSASSQSSNGFSPPSFTAACNNVSPCPSGASLGGGTGAPGTPYSFSLGYGSGNSNVTTANDSVNGNWVFTYDYLNRLSTSNQNNQNGCSYGYDQLGNRTSQTATAGSCGHLSLSYTGNNNRMDGYSYDPAGNLLGDGTHTYAYDAENRLISVDSGNTASYVYDAEGRRVQKKTTAQVEYLYDLNGNIVTELSSTGAWNRGEIFANGRHLATYVNSTTYFDHADWLGTERARSDMTGANCETITNATFGDGQSLSGTGSNCVDANPLHFTGQQWDSESGLHYFPARHYSPQFGRFMSPDPTGIFLGNLNDPQSLNLYSYVRNNPTSMIDPSGACVNGIDTTTGNACFEATTFEVTISTFGGGGGFDCFFYYFLCSSGPVITTDPGPVEANPPLPPPPSSPPHGPNAPPPTRKNSRPQNPSCTAMQARASKLAGLLENVSSQSGWLAFGSGVGAVLSGAAEGPTAGLDTPATITLGGMSSFFGTVSLVSGGVAASLDSYASRNTGAMWNFDVSQLTNVAARAAASKLPLVKPWAERIGDLAEQASDLALKAKGGCE